MDKQPPRFIYITGTDGTGKSTQAQLLLSQLQSQGVRCKHVWLRFPFFLSAPLLAYARWRGYSWYEETEGVRHGYWEFKNSTLLRALLPWTLLLDAVLAAMFKIYWPLLIGQTVVCERFVLDMLVDLAVAFEDKTMYRDIPGIFYQYLIPHNALIVILDLDACTIRERRPDLRSDRKLETRLEVFHQLADDFELVKLSSQLLVNQIRKQIEQLAGVYYG